MDELPSNNKRTLWIAAGLIAFCGFAFLIVIVLGIRGWTSPATPPTIDLFATLAALTPDGSLPFTPTAPTGQPTFSLPTGNAPAVTSTSTPVSTGDQPSGHIVFTCQIFKVQAREQICIIAADGSGFRRLTTEDTRHFYPSLSPDGQSVVYSAFRENNVFELYEMNLTTGNAVRLTNRYGVLTAPEISPKGDQIVFTHGAVDSGRVTIWLMDRNGENAGNIPRIEGWDPTWSPDGRQILFAANRNGSNQLYVMNRDGKQVTQVGSFPSLRGRSDWSALGQIVTYSGEAWKREVYIMNADGSSQRQLTPSGGNSQGPSFSPDGQWVAFTSYFDHHNDIHGCEIYIIRVNGTDMRRLTDNEYCDYQPRWGP